ncbi:hypothetical protein U1Q18_041232, partial [Sarracenia purpurea var. burkii]
MEEAKRRGVDGREEPESRQREETSRWKRPREEPSMEEAKRRVVDGRRTMSCYFDGREELESRRREETRRRRREEP